MTTFRNIAYSVNILSILIVSYVEGHGYLKSPRSRNWVAQQDGVSNGGPASDGKPERDFCPHCLNSKLATNLCSQGNAATLYDKWKDINGNPMAWDSQGTYNEGDEITVESVLTTNHAGHMDMYICPDGDDSTQECLWNNPLTLIRDNLYGGPTDPTYPERAYYSNKETDFSFTYKLPEGVCGEKVLVQWRYITANSCFPPGYRDTEVGQKLMELGWLRASDMSDCGYPYDPTGATGSGKPEQFWNCAEITIKCSYPTISRAPTPIPQPTPDPTPPPPTSTPTAAAGYCSYGGNDNGREACDGEVEGGAWCNENKSNCEGSCAGTWCILSFPTPVTTEWPTYSPVQWPTYSPVQNPTATPIAPPTSCVDKPKDKFLFQMKGKKNKKKPVYKNCKWLAKKPQKKIKKICKKNTDSYNGIGPAKEICKVLCDTCPTASPIQTPPTTSPTKQITATPTKSPTNSGVGCCTIDFKNCSPTVVGWCSESKDNCEGPCNKWWLPNGARDGCVARYESCSTDSDCCSPGVCTSDSGGGKRCKAPAGTPSSPVAPPPTAPIAPPPTAPPAPVKQPTESPVSGPTCCSQFFNVCKDVPWCQESESNCKTCNGVFLPNLPLQCTPRFGMCNPDNDDCCYPSTCVTGTNGGSGDGQCMYYP